MIYKRHKWKRVVYTEGLAKGDESKNRRYCVQCGIEKKLVVAGTRYDLLNGSFVIGKAPVCDDQAGNQTKINHL